MSRTRGARGDSKLNRTLRESPATASLHSATPKRKNVPCSFDFRGDGFFLKWKGHFSFWGSALQVFGQCGGASIRTSESLRASARSIIREQAWLGRYLLCLASQCISAR